jgi:hypothetical protein
MTIPNSFAKRIGVSCVDCVGIKRGLALAQCLVSPHPMIIMRQACRSAGFGDPDVDVAATVVLGVLHIFDIQRHSGSPFWLCHVTKNRKDRCDLRHTSNAPSGGADVREVLERAKEATRYGKYTGHWPRRGLGSRRPPPGSTRRAALFDQLPAVAHDPVDADLIADLIDGKNKQKAFRYLTAPPISEDDLKTVADASLVASRLRIEPDEAARVRDIVALGMGSDSSTISEMCGRRAWTKIAQSR